MWQDEWIKWGNCNVPYVEFVLPHKVKDEPLQRVVVSRRKFINLLVNSPYSLSFLRQLWGYQQHSKIYQSQGPKQGFPIIDIKIITSRADLLLMYRSIEIIDFANWSIVKAIFKGKKLKEGTSYRCMYSLFCFQLSFISVSLYKNSHTFDNSFFRLCSII